MLTTQVELIALLGHLQNWSICGKEEKLKTGNDHIWEDFNVSENQERAYRYHGASRAHKAHISLYLGLCKCLGFHQADIPLSMRLGRYSGHREAVASILVKFTTCLSWERQCGPGANRCNGKLLVFSAFFLTWLRLPQRVSSALWFWKLLLKSQPWACLPGVSSSHLITLNKFLSA